MAVVEVPEELNLAAVHEAIAAVVPDRECIVWRDRRLTWAEVTDRTRRLAAILASAGLGRRHDAAAPEGWQSPHDHIALYLHNGNEYLEGMLGAAKARCAAVNVNYRYVAEELQYVLHDSSAAAIVFGGEFAETLAEVRSALPRLRLLLQVDDGSGAPLLPGAIAYEEALAHAAPGPPLDLSPDDRYLLYTGGTTGMPKGVLWRQADFLAACLGVSSTTEALIAAAPRRRLRALPAPPFMHGAAHWNALSTWIAGGTVIIQDQPAHLDPHDVLRTIDRERATSLLIVGDAFARPLVDALATGDHDGTSLRHLLTGGAILSPSVKGELLALLPDLQIVDVLGSSETGRQGVHKRHRPRARTLRGTDARVELALSRLRRTVLTPMARRTIPLPFAVDLARSMRLLRLGRGDPTIHVAEGAMLRASRTPAGVATLRAQHRGDHLEVEAWGDGAEWALDQAPALLGCLDQREGFDPAHAIVRSLHRRAEGLRLPRSGQVLHALLPAVLSQRVTGFEAKRAYRLLVERWGEPAPGPGGLMVPPTPELLSELGYHELHVIGVEKRRADALKRVAAHAPRLEALVALPPAELRARLEAMPGIGAWTSAEVSRVVLGDADAVSVGDHNLKHLVSWALASEPRGTDARMLELLEPFAGHRGRVCVLIEGSGITAPKHGPRQRIEPIAHR